MSHNTATQSNIADKQHTKQEYELPRDVDVTKNFKFICRGYKYVFGNEKVYFDQGGFCCQCARGMAEGFLLSGHWQLIPWEYTPPPSKQPFPEASFTLAEQIVSKALAPAGKDVAQDYMTLSVHRVGGLMKADARIPANSSKEVVEATKKLLASIYAPMPSPLTDTIKTACKATEGRLSVHTTQNGFEVYHPWFVYNVKVGEEEVLEKLLRVIVLVEGEGGN